MNEKDSKYYGKLDMEKSKNLADQYSVHLIIMIIVYGICIAVFFGGEIAAACGLFIVVQPLFTLLGIYSANTGKPLSYLDLELKAGIWLIISGFFGSIIFIGYVFVGFFNQLIIEGIVSMILLLINVLQIYLGIIYYKIDKRILR